MLHLVTFPGITGFARRRVITWNVLVIDLVITQDVENFVHILTTRSVVKVIVITRDVTEILSQKTLL